MKSKSDCIEESLLTGADEVKVLFVFVFVFVFVVDDVAEEKVGKRYPSPEDDDDARLCCCGLFEGDLINSISVVCFFSPRGAVV